MTVFAVPAVDSTRGRQMSALLAGAHLAEHDLPEIAYWDLNPEGLKLQLAAAFSTAGDLAAVHAWAAFLAADMQVREGFAGTVRVYVTATYRTAPVEVWTTVRLPRLPDTQGES